MWLFVGVLVLVLAAVAFGMAMRRLEQGQQLIGPPRRIDVIGVLLGGAALGIEIYLIENTDRANAGSWQSVSMVLLLIGFVGGGLIIGRWWATVFLPVLAILLSIPAGENHALSEDTPWVSFIYVVLLPVWMALVAVGVVIHKLAARFWPRRRGAPRLA